MWHTRICQICRVGLALDIFCSTLGNAYLRHHFLVVHPTTLEEAITAGIQKLNKSKPGVKRGIHIASQIVQWHHISKLLTGDSGEVADWCASQGSTRKGRVGQKTVCWGWAKKVTPEETAPAKPWDQPSEKTVQGNEKGPQL